MIRTSTTIFFVLLICTACFGQTSFQQLTPGSSTRNEVERALGQPMRPITSTEFEYKPPAGVAKVEVEYHGSGGLVQRIEVYLLKPISRPALIQKFNLPAQADISKANAEGKLVEYFGGSKMVFTYSTGDLSSGVSRIGYYSQESFNSATAFVGGNKGPVASGSPQPPTLKGQPATASNASVDKSSQLTTGAKDASVGSGASWTVPSNFVLIVRMVSSVTSKTAKPGDRIRAETIAAVSAGGKIIIPVGSQVEGQVTQATPAKRMSKAGMIAVDFNELVFANGSRVKIVGILTSPNAEDRSKLDNEGRISGDGTKRTIVFIGSGTGAGAALGAITGGGKGAAVGSAAGAAAGVAIALLAKGPEVTIKSGLGFGIQLSQPVVVRESFLTKQ